MIFNLPVPSLNLIFTKKIIRILPQMRHIWDGAGILCETSYDEDVSSSKRLHCRH